MIFRKSKKEVKKGITKMDGIVTGIIVGGAAASIFGLSRTKKGKKITSKVLSFGGNKAKEGYSFFGKFLANTINFFTKK